MKSLELQQFSLHSFLLSQGCNTVKGIGKDVSAAGEGINKGATAVSNKL